MKVLITGNRGFVGTETQRLFEIMGIQVIGFDLMDNKDIRDGLQFEKCVTETQPDRILHLAAIARFADADKDPILTRETNENGTQNVALIAMKFHIPLVFASTGSVYMPIKREPPITEEFEAYGNSQYGVSKLRGELLVKRLAPLWMVLRYAHIYGKEKRGHGLIGGFVERIERGLAPILYGGAQSNDFTYVKDVAWANYKAITAPWDKWNETYNIGTGEELTAEAAGKVICGLTGYKGKIEKKMQRTVDPQRFVYDVSKADRMLGFKTTFNFYQGLEDMFKKEDHGNQNVAGTVPRNIHLVPPIK